ncbi:hypothetical protein JCM8097_001595 [Rhodosporidiobolus ruineniae]
MSTNEGTWKPCKHCFEGFRLDGEPTGKMDSLDGVSYYIAQGKGEDKTKAIVLGTDIFGFGIANPKLMADKFASSTGLTVYVPDLLEGDYIDTSSLQPTLAMLERQTKTMSLLGKAWYWASLVWGFGVKIGPSYLKRHDAKSVAAPLLEKFCRALKAEKGIQRIGYAGWCYGGTCGTLLSGADSPLDVVVVAHAGGLTEDNFKAVRKPFALICAEEDFGFDSLRPKAVEILHQLEKNEGVPIAIYGPELHPGTTHGFAARPNLADERVRKAWELSMQETQEWWEKHL